MNIQTLTLGPLATNCYLVRADESSRRRDHRPRRELQTAAGRVGGARD